MEHGFWSACEMLDGPSAVKLEWRQLAGEQYDVAKSFLMPMQELATSYPCTREQPCGCFHRVVIHSDDDIVAVCRCNPRCCETVRISKSDIIAYELNRPVLHAAITDTLSLEPAEAAVSYARKTVHIGYDLPRPNVRFPVFLSIQTEPEHYRNIAFSLAAMNNEPFILIVPTLNLWTPDCRDILNMRNAALLTLSDMFKSGDNVFKASPSCQEMLARFHNRVFCTCETRLASGFLHSEDYRCVSLDGRQFTLTSAQAQAIEIMHRAYLNGTPDIGKDYIKVEIGAQSDRLRDTFKSNLDAFSCLIAPGMKRGTYRLNIC